jgi:hypothetical protein
MWEEREIISSSSWSRLRRVMDAIAFMAGLLKSSVSS